MFKKMIAAAVLSALLAVSPVVAGTSETVVSFTATVESYAEWDSASYSVASGEWTGSVDGATINKVGELLTVTKALALRTNTNVTLSATAGDNGGVATNGVETLTTSYMITGDVGTPDVGYKPVSTFFDIANTYTITHVSGDGSYALNLGAVVESEAGRAENAGDYTCSLTLTATW